MPQAIWIKDPLGILADGAERGVVVRDGRIVELVPAGGTPDDGGRGAFDAGGACGAAGADQHPSSFLPDADAGACRRRWTASCFPGCRRSIRSGRG